MSLFCVCCGRDFDNIDGSLPLFCPQKCRDPGDGKRYCHYCKKPNLDYYACDECLETKVSDKVTIIGGTYVLRRRDPQGYSFLGLKDHAIEVDVCRHEKTWKPTPFDVFSTHERMGMIDNLMDPTYECGTQRWPHWVYAIHHHDHLYRKDSVPDDLERIAMAFRKAIKGKDYEKLVTYEVIPLFYDCVGCDSVNVSTLMSLHRAMRMFGKK